MMMKRLVFTILCVLGISRGSYSQTPAYYFNVTADTVTEQNTIHIAGYVKTDTAPVDADSVLVVLGQGIPNDNHIETTNQFVIHISAGQDSVAFSLVIKDDTIPEYTEYLSYVIRNYGSASLVGVDSILNLVIKDNDLPATIRILGTTGWAWEHINTYKVAMEVNNPNTFNVRFTADNHDAYFVGGPTLANAFQLVDFYYNGETIYAPPGIDTIYKDIDIVDNRSLNADKTLACIIRNIDANILVDTLLQFTIRDDDAGPVANYYFNTTKIDSFTEQNATIITGYVKTDSLLFFEDSLYIVLRSGTVSSTQIDHPYLFTLHFYPGQDSVPFVITMHDDTFPQGTEHLTYLLSSTSYWDTVAVDSTRQFVIFDPDLMATIRILGDSGWAWEHDGAYTVVMQVNNPTPYNVRFVADNHDTYYVGGAPLTARSIIDFYYNGEVLYAPPGIDTIYKVIAIVDDTINQPDKTLACVIRNIDANIMTDTLFPFRIRNDDYHYPPSVSFDFPSITVNKDSVRLLHVPFTIVNPNWRNIDVRFDTVLGLSSITTNHLSLQTPFYSVPHGTWHDSITVFLSNDYLLQDTQISVLGVKGVAQNTSTDTLFSLIVVGGDSAHISFKGAAMAHLKSDSVGYVQVLLNGAAKFPITADVKYLNGNATPGIDFIFRDTSIVFPANQFDTIVLPVWMLKDHLHQGNEQVNFELVNVQPAYVIPDIIRYTYIIIDDDSTAVYASIIENGKGVPFKAYPTPFADKIKIETELRHYSLSLINALGQTVCNRAEVMGDIELNTSDLPAGIYILRVAGEGYAVERKIIK